MATDPTLKSLYADHMRDVWHTLRRLGVQTRDLEDATHEVFLVAFRRWDSYDPTRSGRAWLTGIAWRVAAGERRRARNRKVSIGFAREPGDMEARDAHQLTEAAEARALVHHVLAGLPDPQRDVFVLHELDGMSMPEIVEMTEVPLNTLYSRLRLARKKFKAEVLRLQDAQEVRP
ncbi:MAG: sigma-70 family RNA polymerase sigma factor [Myxococcales bacterium]|nr:sigma-70 family RNA polymerase sigma factor [Myxococcales bacterium]